jgi:hypothetical protein
MLAGIERLLGRRVERRMIDGFDDIETGDGVEAAAEPHRARPRPGAKPGQGQPGRKHHPRPRGDSRDQTQRGAAPGTDGAARHRGRGRGRPDVGGNRRSPVR